MAETAAAADLLAQAGSSSASAGARRAGVARCRGVRLFGFDHDEAREKTALFRAAIAGAGVAPPMQAAGRERDASGPAPLARPRRPHLVGFRLTRDRRLGREQGMNLMSSTLLLEDTQVPFDDSRPSRSSSSRGLDEGRPHPGAARLGEPQR